MYNTSPGKFTRRYALMVSGVGILGAISACTSASPADGTTHSNAPPAPAASDAPNDGPSGSSGEPTDTTAANDATRTTMLGLIFTARQHVAHLTQAIADDADRADTYTMLRSDRQAHLDALNASYQRVFTTPPPQPSTTETPDPRFPTTAEKVVSLLRTDATAAQNDLTDAMAQSSAYAAQLYGSMAACEATHRQVLATVLA